MNSNEITWQLCNRHWSYRRQICIPRCSLLGWEADLLVMRPSAWLEEVEIKISVSDFRREFVTKADKHVWLERGRPVHHWRKTKPEVDDPEKLEPITVGDKIIGWKDWSKIEPHIVHRYWFAMPEELATKLEGEIPAYAGLLAVGNRWTRVVRPAPALEHSRKMNTTEQLKLMRLGYIRYWGRKAEVMQSLDSDPVQGLDDDAPNIPIESTTLNDEE